MLTLRLLDELSGDRWAKCWCGRWIRWEARRCFYCNQTQLRRLGRRAYEGAHGLGFIIQSRPGPKGYTQAPSDEAREKFRAGRTGKKMSLETRAKVSATLRARQQRNAA